MARRALLLAALLLLPALALTPAASACFSAVGVPCGRIYPLILMQVEDQAPTYPLAVGSPIVVEALLTYRFDMTNEGYTTGSPTEPITIGFEFPRKPAWADIRVEPERIPIDVNDPRYVQPDTSNPTTPQASYVYTTPITITIELTGQPILKDGYDYQKLLVFAKSTESGLYQAGYGIKEIRAIPAGALHESDVAGTRDVFTAVPLPALALGTVSTSFAGTTVTIDPPAEARFWEPTLMTARVEPAPAGRLVFAVHDETGALLAQTAPLDSASGAASLNVSFLRPGLHTATLTLLPSTGGATVPMTYALDFETGSREGEGWQYPKAYVVSASEVVPVPLGSRTDALVQFERDIPFFAFDTAQSASASVTLKTPGLADAGRALTNLQFSIVAPDGKELAIGSVDPTKPQWSLRIGTLPEEGWYALRVKGLGAPLVAGYDARIDVNYAAMHEARNRADGLPDATGDLLSLGGRNLTLPATALGIWVPGDLTPALDGADSLSYQVTVVDANATPVYASGIRSGAARFTAPAPASYRAFVYAEPEAGATPYAPLVRAFAFSVGVAQVTVADKFSIDDAWESPTFAAEPATLGFHALPAGQGEGAMAGDVNGGWRLVDEEGVPTEDESKARYLLVTSSAAPGGQGKPVEIEYTMSYDAPQTLTGPDAAVVGAQGGVPVPGLAIGLLLAAAGVVAVAVAMLRRRGD